MGTKGVVLHYAAPVSIDHALAVFLGANSILPMIFIGKAPARPAKYRQLNIFQGFHYIGTYAIDIGNGGIFTYKYTIVNTTAQMFGKIAIQVTADSGFPFPGVNSDSAHNQSPP